MSEYVDRLVMCGYRVDDAWMAVSDFMRELDWDALFDFVRMKESCNVEKV